MAKEKQDKITETEEEIVQDTAETAEVEVKPAESAEPELKTAEPPAESTEEVSQSEPELAKFEKVETSYFDSEIQTDFNPEPIAEDGPVTVKPVRFASFEELNQVQGEVNKNLEILMDIKLQMTVELGRTELPIKKVLELTRGSIIELEKVAGEPVELYANGKLVAHGEVVVIEDNFGLRITSITEPEDRLKGV